MNGFAHAKQMNRWIEPVLAASIVSGLVWTMLHLAWYGYLPYPFFYEPSDIWMDWFNPAYWAHNGGAYDTWGSIYPPLSFVMLLFLGKSSCYVAAEGLSSRDCDWVGAVALHAIFLLNIILIARTFIKIDRSTALPRSIALASGLPMLFALERGNLIIPTFTCILLAYGPLIKSARWRWLAAGLAINFKIYLIASLFPQLLRRRWRWFEGAVIATVFVYLATLGILGEGTPNEIYDNIIGISDIYQAGSFLDGWYSSSYTPFLSLLDGPYVPVLSIIGSQYLEILKAILPLLLYLTQATILIAIVAAWLRPEAIPMYRLTGLGIAFAVITAESGGYVQALVILFVFMERWKGVGIKWAIIACYILCIPADIPIDQYGSDVRESFLSNRPVVFNYVLTLGPFIRPLLLMSIPFALSCVTIRAVWADIMQQGWKTRWRYRNDLPIMIGEGLASPPPNAPQK